MPKDFFVNNYPMDSFSFIFP